MLCAGLGVLVGIICIAAGLLRLGFVANFLSKSVIVGFMHGIALVIVGAQLPKVLGIRSEGETTLDQFASTFARLDDTNLMALAIGAGSFAVILLCKRFLPRVPGHVVALVVSLLLVALLRLDKQGVAIVGHIPTGLPGLSLPEPSLADFEDLLAIAMVAALLSFSDTMVTARAFAQRNKQRIDPDQELIGIGAANLVSGVTQGLPISASDSRTAVAEAAGSRTQVTSIVAAVVVACVMLFLAEYLYYLPTAALGGILVAAAWGLCDFAELGRLWRFRGISLAGALVTLVGVVVVGLMEGILLGVAYSLILLLRALAFPNDAVLGRAPDGGWHDPAHRAEAVLVPGLVVYRFSAPLFFANCGIFRDRIEALVESAGEPVRAVVIDGGAIHDVDLMACEMLNELYDELAGRGIQMLFGNLRSRVRRDIERGLALQAEDNDDISFPTVAAAAQSVRAESDPPR
jgi:high affinity sulfate transporter 1